MRSGSVQPGVVPQRPEMQGWPEAQRTPQVPQLLASKEVSVHRPPQLTCGGVQVPPVQLPPAQRWPVAQASPHTPQLAASEETSVHDAPHITRGDAQVGVGARQAPAMHD
jgi:hypothetical protein